jgi:Tfp pilus assembly protein PilN
MINLLPQKEKDGLLLIRIKNLALIFGGIVIIFLICLILVMLSIKFYILTEVDSQKFLLQATQEKYNTPEITSLKSVIGKYSASLPTVAAFYKNEKYLSDILTLISEIQKPAGVYFTNISINIQNKVSISGVSNTRENLIAFQKNLESQAKIKNVSFSANSWINPVNNNFIVTLEYGN